MEEGGMCVLQMCVLCNQIRLNGSHWENAMVSCSRNGYKGNIVLAEPMVWKRQDLKFKEDLATINIVD